MFALRGIHNLPHLLLSGRRTSNSTGDASASRGSFNNLLVVNDPPSCFYLDEAVSGGHAAAGPSFVGVAPDPDRRSVTGLYGRTGSTQRLVGSLLDTVKAIDSGKPIQKVNIPLTGLLTFPLLLQASLIYWALPQFGPLAALFCYSRRHFFVFS